MSQPNEQQEWLKMAATNPVFEFLQDAEEDIYTLEDGQPLDDESQSPTDE